MLRKTPLIRRAAARNVRRVRRSEPIDYAGFALPKNPPRRDPKLREWIAKQPCMIERILRELTGNVAYRCTMKTHAAHVPTGTGGMGMKGDDLFVPLCFEHHIDEQHGKGIRWFTETYGVDLIAEARKYEEEFRRAA